LLGFRHDYESLLLRVISPNIHCTSCIEHPASHILADLRAIAQTNRTPAAKRRDGCLERTAGDNIHSLLSEDIRAFFRPLCQTRVFAS
jgi:hypothetical protein